MQSKPFRLFYVAIVFAVVTAGCGSDDAGHETPEDASHEAATHGETAPEAAAPAKTYDSPEAAFDALIEAARSESTDAIRDVLGMASDEELGAGDPVQFKNDVEAVVALYDEQHVAAPNEAGGVTLVVGANEWPFPIPVVEHSGAWAFDLESGRQEIDDRRVGRNELAAIQVCKAIGDAQREYQAMNPEGTGAYAAKFFSDPGTKNGLYWPAQEGEPQSPLGELAAAASAEGYERGTAEEPAPFFGYHYRILTEQGRAAPGGARDYYVDGKLTGGFAVLAYPAAYGRSGIMSFLVGPFGIVYECDLGEDTEQIATGMKAFDPELTWTVSLDQ